MQLDHQPHWTPERIRAALEQRRRNRLSEDEFARSLGVSFAQVRDWARQLGTSQEHDRQETLLKRMARGGPARRPLTQESSPTEFEAFEQSVLRNIRRILGSRQGHSEALPDYGLPDFSRLHVGQQGSFPDAAQRFAAEVGEVLSRYEPRLTDVVVWWKRPKQGAVDPFVMELGIQARPNLAAGIDDEVRTWVARVRADGQVPELKREGGR